MRIDGRAADEGRSITIQTGFVATAAGSCLISTGNTKVICTASVEESVPGWRKGQGKGWVTAEYAMLPASGNGRTKRELNGQKGRTHEIQRLIGRSLRAVTDMKALGEVTVTVD